MNSRWKITKRQLFLLAYLPVHIMLYVILEKIDSSNFIVMHCKMDDIIPFCEWFIIPYLLWFPYMVVAGIYFLQKDAKTFERYVLSMFIGFFVGMVIIALYPTVQNLRPQDLQNGEGIDNFAKWLVSFIYTTDTNTRVFPSLHVVGALGVGVNVALAPSLRKKVWLQIGNWVMCISIILSTMFAKQHSALDVIAGLILETIVIIIVFKGWPSKLVDKITKTQLDEGNDVISDDID